MKYLIILMLLVSCGTETGNPITNLTGNPDSGTVSDEDTLTFSYSLATTSCEKLVECYSDLSDVGACRALVLQQDGFDTALSLSTDYDTLTEILNDEKDGDLEKQETESNQCITDIRALGCSDTEVINAYDSASPNDFGQVSSIVPVGAGSCQDSLSTP